MKKLKLIAVIALMGAVTSPLFAQQKKTDSKVQRDTLIIIHGPQKEVEKIAEEITYDQALKAIKTQQFVLEADRVMFKDGYMAYVSTNTNFVMQNKDKSTVQVAFNNGFSGPNGIGGVTVDGITSGNKIDIDKKGNVNYSFNTLGSGLSARITITLYAGGNSARVDILPNFSSNMLTLSGKIIPLEMSNIFKGSVSY